MSLATTASPKPSFSAPWRMDDAVVGRGNAGWTTSKSGHPCSCQNCSQWPPAEKIGKGIAAGLSPMSPRRPNRSRDWTELHISGPNTIHRVTSRVRFTVHATRHCVLKEISDAHDLIKLNCLKKILLAVVNKWNVNTEESFTENFDIVMFHCVKVSRTLSASVLLLTLATCFSSVIQKTFHRVIRPEVILSSRRNDKI